MQSDASTLAEYAERMAFVAWTRPSTEKISLRSVARRIHTLTKQKAAAKNHLHALSATVETPKAVLKDANLAISQLEKRIDSLTTAALLLIAKHPELARILHLLISIKGIAEASAIALIGELLLLPPNLSHRQWVTTQGLTRKPSSQVKASTKKRAFLNQATFISVPLLCACFECKTDQGVLPASRR